MARKLAPEILYSAEEIERRVQELGRAIAEQTPEHGEIAALIVLKGAFVFGADLLRAIDRKTRVGFLETHKDPDDPGATDFVFTHPFPIQGADLLIIEDILDTGITLTRLQERMASRRPARIRTAVLLDKVPRREVETRVEYRGFEIPDKWVVGYGLDDGETYRNLPYIGFVEE